MSSRCDGKLVFRGASLRCRLPAIHAGPCRTEAGLTFQRVDSWSVRGASLARTRHDGFGGVHPTRQSDTQSEHDDCQCSVCHQPCRKCTCRPAAKLKRRQSERVLANDARRHDRDGARRTDEARQRRARWQADGLCYKCGQREPEKPGGQCRPCLDRAAGAVWRSKQERRILTAPEWSCQHGPEDPLDCRSCRVCVRIYVRENEIRAARSGARETPGSSRGGERLSGPLAARPRGGGGRLSGARAKCGYDRRVTDRVDRCWQTTFEAERVRLVALGVQDKAARRCAGAYAHWRAGFVFREVQQRAVDRAGSLTTDHARALRLHVTAEYARIPVAPPEDFRRRG